MSENRKKLGHIFLTVAPCLIATLLAGVYILGIYPSLSLTFVNILCIPLVTIVFVCGLTEEINVLKAFRFAASILIAGIETFLNSDGITFEAFHFGNLSLWGCGWVGLLFLSILSFLVVLIRLLHWTQESWMEVKKMRQNRRMERKKFWAEYMSAWQQQRLEAQKNRQERWAQKAQHEKEILHGKQVADMQKREQGYEREKVGQEHQKEKQNERFKNWKDNLEQRRQNKAAGKHPVHDTALKILKIVGRPVLFVLIVIVLAILFWRVPYCVSAKVGTENAVWMDYVVKFVELLDNQDNKQESVNQPNQTGLDSISNQLISGNQAVEDEQDEKHESEVPAAPSSVQALIYYLLIYIVAVGAIVMLLFILWNIAGRLTHNKETNLDFDFAKDYDLPVSILLVFIAILFVLGGNSANFVILYQASHWWEVLSFIIILVIIVFVTIEIILIIIKQCSQPESLMKNIIYLTFVAILELVSSLLLSIITNLRIQSIVSGLLALIFMPDDDDSFASDIESRKQAMFRREINYGSKNSNSIFKKSYGRRRIWRRYRK